MVGGSHLHALVGGADWGTLHVHIEGASGVIANEFYSQLKVSLLLVVQQDAWKGTGDYEVCT